MKVQQRTKIKLGGLEKLNLANVDLLELAATVHRGMFVVRTCCRG
jgi:hypothetical protein